MNRRQFLLTATATAVTGCSAAASHKADSLPSETPNATTTATRTPTQTRTQTQTQTPRPTETPTPEPETDETEKSGTEQQITSAAVRTDDDWVVSMPRCYTVDELSFKNPKLSPVVARDGEQFLLTIVYHYYSGEADPRPDPPTVDQWSLIELETEEFSRPMQTTDRVPDESTTYGVPDSLDDSGLYHYDQYGEDYMWGSCLAFSIPKPYAMSYLLYGDDGAVTSEDSFYAKMTGAWLIAPPESDE